MFRRTQRPYRSLSVLAVVSLILGLLSAAALTQPVLLLLPIAGMVIGGLAVRHTRRDDVSGRGIAICGRLASVFFFCFAITDFMYGYRMVFDHAERFADKWIDLVQAGRLNAADQMTMSPELRVQRSELLEAYYQEHEDDRRRVEKLFQRDGYRELAVSVPEGRVRRVAGRQKARSRSEQVFEFDYVLDVGSVDVPFQLLVVRRWSSEFQQVDWKIVIPAERKHT